MISPCSSPRLMTYLDANATEPLRPCAADAMLEATRFVGNPSSIHTAGRAARALLENARNTIARALGADPLNCIFTSGGTEANALALHALGAGRRFLVGRTEHDAVRQSVPTQAPLEWLDVDQNGQIRLDLLEQSLAQPGALPAFVCLMFANNETGVLHPMAEIVRLCHHYGAHLHVDAVQAVGRVELSLLEQHFDSLACSGHKIGGPKGAGALLIQNTTHTSFTPLFVGGGQEQGRRGGTPALPSIVGFAAALQDALQHPVAYEPLHHRLEQAARSLGAVICGEKAPRLGNTSCLALPGQKAQTQLMRLDLEGICVSAGSACSSGKVTISHVLEAMGLGDLAGQAIRVSLPWNVTEADIDHFIQTYTRLVATSTKTH
ncbi:MAG: cysteine desulfurase [Acetobacter sp.]|nr:cysteine desulfurase [Acetobacter sp.]